MSIEKYRNITISSLEIAEITGKQHKNVIRDIETQLTEILGEKALLKFEQSYTNSNNRKFKCYNLPKLEALIVVSGYDAKLRASIIYRLDELERKSLQELENKTGVAISYNDYSNAIEEANKAKIELCNAKHQITKERLKNANKSLKIANKQIDVLKKEIEELEYKLTTNGANINMLEDTIKKLHAELDKK